MASHWTHAQFDASGGPRNKGQTQAQKQVAKATAAAQRSVNQARMELALRAVGIEFEEEYKFHAGRKWRFDFAFPTERIALEIEGGIHSKAGTNVKSRHASGEGFAKDCEKYNEAVILGWHVLHVTSEMVKDGRALQFVERALAG